MKTTFMANASNIERKWYVVDAEGQTLGRLAAEVAKVLRGKHKPTFTPHVDTGDYVIVVNAAKVKLTGKKLIQKTYFRHSGYRGGMPMGMGGKNQMQMMKQAQKMQQDLLKMQEEMESKEYEASAGGGVITAVVSGKRELVRVNIDPEAVDPDDVEMLQDMIVAAVNEAMRKAEADSASSMSKLTGGLNLGGLF